jgi:hypothetical protein
MAAQLVASHVVLGSRELVISDMTGFFKVTAVRTSVFPKI